MSPRSHPLLLAALLAPLPAHAGGDAPSVIRNIAVAMVAASALGFLAKVLRQPPLLGYILGGVLIGPIGLGWVPDREEVETISEIGLILLLFMIGLEIDLKQMLRAGRWVVITGVLQFPLTLGLGYLAFSGLSMLGLSAGEGPYAVLYLALAIGISSTMIVVKLLYDKQELDTLPGRLTVGILVFQDIWAIVALAIQPNLADPELSGLLWTFGAGALLVAASFAASRFLLPRIFHVVAKLPELMLVLSLGWCFLVGLIAARPEVGLSMEMGALVAGVALATFPYNLDVNAKVLNIRDFFITLFFVSLGMQIPVPTAAVLGLSAAVAGVLFLTRAVGIFGVLAALGAGHRTSLLPAINLSQMSEFSLVILAAGVGFGHIGRDTLGVGIWSFALLAVASTYLISYNHVLERRLGGALRALGLRDLGGEAEARPQAHRRVVLLGFFRIAGAFLEDASRRGQHLLEELAVVDFNPEVRGPLLARGVPIIYGDVSSPDTLHHAELVHAKVVVCTLSDTVLRGTTNAKLLQLLQGISPQAKLIMTAETPAQARELYALGADYVLQPSVLAGASMLLAIDQALRGSCQGMREEAVADLATRAGT